MPRSAIAPFYHRPGSRSSSLESVTRFPQLPSGEPTSPPGNVDGDAGSIQWRHLTFFFSPAATRGSLEVEEARVGQQHGRVR